MGTHNHLMRLGRGIFLELIAVNPAAPAPTRPRWYGLDDPFVRARLAEGPQLLTWVVNTPQLEHLPGLPLFFWRGRDGEPGRPALAFWDSRRRQAFGGRRGALPHPVVHPTPPRRGDGRPWLLLSSGLEIHHPQPDVADKRFGEYRRGAACGHSRARVRRRPFSSGAYRNAKRCQDVEQPCNAHGVNPRCLPFILQK